MSEQGPWSSKTLRLFSELIQIQNTSVLGETAGPWRDFCSDSIRALEPTVRALVEWVKQRDTEDEALQYVRKSN